MFNRRNLILLAAVVASLAVVASASAVKLPTYYVYSSKKGDQNAYQQGSKIVAFAVSKKCNSKQAVSIGSTGKPVKIKSNGKFSFKVDVSTYSGEYPDTVTTTGKATVKGKVSFKSKVKGTWKLDKVSTDCSKVDHGSFSMKYKGVAHGG